jgi:hypothetical protein
VSNMVPYRRPAIGLRALSRMFTCTLGCAAPALRTEIGILRGRSVRAWSEYFPLAHIWGVDLPQGQRAEAKRYVENCSRVSLRYGDSRDPRTPARFGFGFESMDVIIDDGDHYQPSNVLTLGAWWPYLRPGGVYCVEDVATGANHKNRYGGGDIGHGSRRPRTS